MTFMGASVQNVVAQRMVPEPPWNGRPDLKKAVPEPAVGRDIAHHDAAGPEERMAVFKRLADMKDVFRGAAIKHHVKLFFEVLGDRFVRVMDVLGPLGGVKSIASILG